MWILILLACVHTGVTEELLEEENDRMMSDISSKTRTLKQVGFYLSLCTCICICDWYSPTMHATARYFTPSHDSCTYLLTLQAGIGAAQAAFGLLNSEPHELFTSAWIVKWLHFS